MSRKAVFSPVALGSRPLRKGPATAQVAASVERLTHQVLRHQRLHRTKPSSAVRHQTEIKKALSETLERYEKESQTYAFQTSPSGSYVGKKQLRLH